MACWKARDWLPISAKGLSRGVIVSVIHLQPFWYNTVVWQTDTHTQTHTNVVITILRQATAPADKESTAYNERYNGPTLSGPARPGSPGRPVPSRRYWSQYPANPYPKAGPCLIRARQPVHGRLQSQTTLRQTPQHHPYWAQQMSAKIYFCCTYKCVETLDYQYEIEDKICRLWRKCICDCIFGT